MSTICRKAIGTILPKRRWLSRISPKTPPKKKKAWFAQEKAPAKPVDDKKSWKDWKGPRERIRERKDRRRKENEEVRRKFRRMETKEYFRELGFAVLRACAVGAKAVLPVVVWISCVTLPVHLLTGEGQSEENREGFLMHFFESLPAVIGSLDVDVAEDDDDERCDVEENS